MPQNFFHQSPQNSCEHTHRVDCSYLKTLSGLNWIWKLKKKGLVWKQSFEADEHLNVKHRSALLIKVSMHNLFALSPDPETVPLTLNAEVLR